METKTRTKTTKGDSWVVLKDDGYGYTPDSLNFWAENKKRIGTIVSIEVGSALRTENRWTNGHLININYNSIIIGAEGEIWLSGCSCGYEGKGSNGTETILIELGLSVFEARDKAFKPEFFIEFSCKDVTNN